MGRSDDDDDDDEEDDDDAVLKIRNTKHAAIPCYTTPCHPIYTNTPLQLHAHCRYSRY